MNNRILLVEDQDSLRYAISEFLLTRKFEVVGCDSCECASETLMRFRPDAAVLDYSLPDGNAIQILDQIKQIDPFVPVVILTAYGSIELAVEAVKKGAENFLSKPIELSALALILERALDSQRAKRKQAAKTVQRKRTVLDPFVGTSTAIRKLGEQARKLANADSPVLITGETGTGKTVIARWLHFNGPRREEPFVDLNCATFSRELLESELFGYEKGAFTGAAGNKQGLIEIAHRGTVFLDEIGDIDLQIQPKLLKVVEEKQLRRLGDIRDRSVDVRLIAATNQDLLKLVDEKRFRGDLYFRISTIPLTVPTLRERREDIPLLAKTLLRGFEFSPGLSQGPLELSDCAIHRLQNYSWPGNIRELRNVLERAALLSDKNLLHAEDLYFEQRQNAAGTIVSTNMTLLEAEKVMIEAVLKEESWHVPSAARRLGLPRSSLYHKVRQYGIKLNRAEEKSAS